MGSIHQVIEAFRDEPSNSERGTKFEKLMVRYFQMDPMLSQQYDQVYRWIDWPGREGKADTGIDLVARAADTGEFTAIQCKFYEPTTTLAKSDIDSFFTASGKAPFTNRIIISTTDKWGKNAEDALEGQSIPVQRIGLAEIADSPISWDLAWPQGDLQIDLAPAVRHDARPHQQQAIDAVFKKFSEGHERGQLIMACGTGKTFTALKIAERLANENGGSARILFAVPSISLLSQTLREWTAQTQLDLRAFAVCSDNKVSRAAEDIGVHDVAIPVTTSTPALAEAMSHRKRTKGLTVVFTTYQSLPTVADAQAMTEGGVDPFDLVICDEAHRTTGVTLLDERESNFVAVHDPDYIHASRRLYMTATPRIFGENTKAKAEEFSAQLTSMDNEDDYGPEFHRLSFGEAVDRGLLTDYKVIVLTVDEGLVAAPLQAQFAGPGNELRLDDATKIVGCWNGLAKRAGNAPDGSSFPPGAKPMQRAVAFAKDIASSKQVAELFPRVVEAYRDLLQDSENDGADINTTNLDLTCTVEHVDGTFNALKRNEKLRWLKGFIPEGECRILTNARCLSEGVDVPALDAVLFLHPRNSQVDVVQSVGRVMRKSPGKDYGYIILPVAVPAGVSPSQALSDNQRFRVVWQILNALRAHDERFDAMVNSLALNKTDADTKKGKSSDKLLGGHIGGERPEHEPDKTNPEKTDGPEGSDDSGGLTTQMALFSLSEWQEAIFARIVDKVGDRKFWEDWANDVAVIAASLVTRISAMLDGADAGVTEAFSRFLQGLRDNLNESITPDDAVSMLAQHLITKPVFDALFEGHEFAASNPVSLVMEAMVAQLGGAGLEAETAHLEKFYDSVRVRASEVTTAEGKQQVIADLYHRFFEVGFKKQSDALGIVYTPTQIVDFILHAADDALRDTFGRGLTDKDVYLLDPFTGTGTFITRLLQSGIIKPADLARKYANELFANEIMLLAYYIAAVNIESTYHAITGEPYTPFQGIVLADTFQITEDGDSMDSVMFPQNNDRILRQLAVPINVVVGNPPYSVGQTSANEGNANIAYPTLDSRISATYAARSTAQLKNSLYDSYLRGFRWATDRIGTQGVVAFVSNGGWIDGNTADGIRISLAEEYNRIYVYNLRGNQRTAGEQSRKEGGKIFDSGSRNTIAIFIGVKDPSRSGPCEIYYRDIGDYLSRDDKLRMVADGSLATINWASISPNSHGDWISQRDDKFSTWPRIDDKAGELSVFRTHSGGLKTNRDSWVYNFSRSTVNASVQQTIDFYNSQTEDFAEWRTLHKPADVKRAVEKFIDLDPTKISWNRGTRHDVARGIRYRFRGSAVTSSIYRPFTKQHVYFDRQLNEVVGKMPAMFPTSNQHNVGFIVMAPRETAEFAAVATDLLPDLSFFTTTAQFFPRWTYQQTEPDDGGLDLGLGAGNVDEHGYRRVDNITDEIVALYKEAIGSVSKDDVFYYVYGLLHDPSYRQTYAADLRRMLPRIPTPSTRARFDQLAVAGRALAELHIGYESVEPYPLHVELKASASSADRETWRVTKMKWRSKGDFTSIVYSPKVTISGIPAEAERYQLGSRSALGWIIDRYRVKPDPASGIVNDPNDWCDEVGNPKYIVDLIKRVTTVALETMKIVDGLA